MQRILCPSMMCASYEELQKEVCSLDAAGCDIFHVDIMDGKFVKNFGMGIQDIEVIRRNTKKPIDVHLMIERPAEHIELFVQLGVDIIYIHPDSDVHPARTLQSIRQAGKEAGIALNPGISISTIEELLPLVDDVLVMTVNPGFAGQQYLPFVDQKIERLVERKKEFGFRLMVDGAISPERVRALSEIGVDGFVLGTSALFHKPESYEHLLKQLRE